MVRVVVGRPFVLDVVLVVHVIGAMLRMVLGPLVVIGIHAFGLDQLVDLGADEAGQRLLGERVRDLLAW